MSSSTKATTKGGKISKMDKSHKSDKSDSGKGSGDKQLGHRDHNSKSEDPGIKEKVRTLIEMSNRSEEEVCLALHECDMDVTLAINLLLEKANNGEWETTTVKKKKNRQSSISKKEKAAAAAAAAAGGDENVTIVDEWNDNSNTQSGGGVGGDKDKTRNKSGGPPRLHGRHNDSRSGGGGWRARERQENERNLEDGGNRGDYRGDRRGRPGGSARGGGGGRGRGGGRAGGGRYPPRGGRSNSYNKPIDTWDNSNNTWDNSTAVNANHNTTEDTWDDFPGTDEWSTEEYTGSLADTKVFTPSIPPKVDVDNPEVGLPGTTVSGNTDLYPGLNAGQPQQVPQQQSVQMPSQSPVPPQQLVGSLNAAQTQYLNQLQQQNSDSIKTYSTSQTFQGQTYEKTGTQAYSATSQTAQPYSSTSQAAQPYSATSQTAQPYSATSQTAQPYSATSPTAQPYSATSQTAQPYSATSQTAQAYSATSQTAQPYSATSQTAQSYSASTQQYGSQPQQNAYVNSGYTVNSNYVAGTSPEQQQTQQQQQPPRTKTQRARLPPPSKIPSSAVEMPGDLNSSIGYLDVQFGAMDFMSDSSSFDGVNETKYSANSSSVVDNTSNTSATGNLDLNTSNQSSTAAPALDTYSPKPSSQQSSISSALTQSLGTTDTSIQQQSSEHLSSGYSSGSTSRSTTSANAVTAATAPTGLELSKQQDSHTYAQSSTYNSYPSKASYNASTYSGSQTTSSSYISNQANNSYVNSQSGSYNTPSANTYQNTYSSTTSYQNSSNTPAYSSITQANSYPTTNQSYPQNSSQSVYGANTGLNNSSNYGNTASNPSQYNSYSSSASGGHKLVKDSTYDNSSSSTVSSTQTTTTNNVSTASLSLAQSTVAGSKTTTTLAAKNSNNVVSNIPPGVTPVMSTPYILGQVPYFQQPVYSYEDMQLLQQRLPHMTAPYYDMSYQTTPTTLATVRDAAALGNVAAGYSLSSDGRFTRGDNNASPVPSTLSQQTTALTQGHQAQPILAGTAPQYFFAPTAFNTLPNYQFGMYTQLPAATNAHGTSNSNQYPKAATYGSGYGAYDALSQTQDYTKGGYVSNTQGQKGAGGNASNAGSTGNDLSAMYGKSHTALGKVNSYEKQGFHSGTPPPFTGALHGSQNAGLAPSGTGYAPQVYIPTMAPHQQHHSTPLMHQPLHQMNMKQSRNADSGNSSGQRSQASNQAKAGAKQPYPTYSSWNQA